jgi:SAM-dependent methyltransferase
MDEPNLPYLLPRENVQEINRLDRQHVLLFSALHSNIVAPVEHPTHILDVGCGTGRWCREVAETFPQAQVIGLDLSVPSVSPWPSNCAFVVANILEQGLPFPAHTFDYVHQRLLIGAIPTERWSEVIGEQIRVTKPGGWVELVESSGVLPQSGPVTQQLSQWLGESGKRHGIDITQAPGLRLHERFQAAGLEQVTFRSLFLPMSNQADPFENLTIATALGFFRAMEPLVVRELGVSADEYEACLQLLPEEWARCQTTSPFYLVYGQCPAEQVGVESN